MLCLDRELKAHVNGVRCLQIVGNTLVSGGADKNLFVWNLLQNQCELILKGHEGGIFGIHAVGKTKTKTKKGLKCCVFR